MSRKFSFPRWVLVITVLCFAVALVGTRPALAAGVVGNGTAASCTESAFDTALAGGGSVTFNCGAVGVVITLTTNKQPAFDTTIDGGNKITLKAPNIYHFLVNPGITLTLKNIQLIQGNTSSGGSIHNYGTFKAINVKFHNNRSTDYGGAIYSEGTLVIKQSTFTKNRATFAGGAIYNNGGNATIKASTFTSNKATNASATGGAVANQDGDVRIINSTLNNNSGDEGGAFWTQFNSTNTLKNSVLSGNKGVNGAGLENFGGIEVVNSKIMNNTATGQGGGIYHGGFMSISKSTISGNKAATGGGMRDFGNSTDIQQSTFSSNQATGDGGGIYTSASLGVRNSTFSGNSAGAGHFGGAIFAYNNDISLEYVTVANNTAPTYGGVYSDGVSNASIYMQNTALSNNTNGNCGGATIVSGGFNLSSDNSCSSELNQNGDQNNKNAKLGALASNGGPTQTHLPLAGSPLINKGKTDNHINFDQRGFTRPVGPKADIGAVEVQ